jgi:hypothetical protein
MKLYNTRVELITDIVLRETENETIPQKPSCHYFCIFGKNIAKRQVLKYCSAA